MYTAINLFAGVGGFIRGVERTKEIKVIWAIEKNKYSRIMLKENIKDCEIIEEDIRKIDLEKIPTADMLLAAFPYQPFAVSGKKMGLNDQRGQLFFKIIDIIKNKKNCKQPYKVIFLENIRNLLKHNNGKTLSQMINEIEMLGYKVFYKVLNSKFYGVPQNRKRIYIVAFLKDYFGGNINFNFPEPETEIKVVKDILENKVAEKYYLDQIVLSKWNIKVYEDYIKKDNMERKRKKYYQIKGKDLLEIVQEIYKENKKNGFYLLNPEKPGRAIRPCWQGGPTYKRNFQIYLIDGEIRRLTPRECFRMQGFKDDELKIVVSDEQAYKQAGETVTVPVIEKISEKIIDVLRFSEGR